jgi:hypothetical protein
MAEKKREEGRDVVEVNVQLHSDEATEPTWMPVLEVPGGAGEDNYVELVWADDYERPCYHVPTSGLEAEDKDGFWVLRIPVKKSTAFYALTFVFPTWKDSSNGDIMVTITSRSNLSRIKTKTFRIYKRA